MIVTKKFTAPTFDITGLTEREAKDLVRILYKVSTQSEGTIYSTADRLVNAIQAQGKFYTDTISSYEDGGMVRYIILDDEDKIDGRS